MLSKLRKILVDFFQSKKDTPVITAISAGLYPMLFYYNNNLLTANSWIQIIWFLGWFIIAPIAVIKLAIFVNSKVQMLSGYKIHLLTGLNLLFFGVLLLNVTNGITKKYILVVAVSAFSLAFLIYKHLKKIIVIQLLLALMALVMLLPKVLQYLSYSDDWLVINDDITSAEFKKTPNIYVIQPDGYCNFSEIDKGHYQFDNSNFKQFLQANEFKIYDNFRSNYYSTLTSNASMFAMKHHFFFNSKHKNDDYYDYRKVLAGESSAIKTLQHNDYKTFLLLDYPYMIINRPIKKVDDINYSYTKMSFLSNQWKGKEPLDDLKSKILQHENSHNFFFIEKILPTHIENLSSKSQGVEGERLDYIKRVKESNIWLQNMIDTIVANDDNPLIVIVSDHGGYVGMASAEEVYVKNEDPSITKSIFTSMLAIKWPNNQAPDFDDKLKTNVNLFRVLYSYLANDTRFLNNLEADKSYQIINKGAPSGVYELINENYQVVFKKK